MKSRQLKECDINDHIHVYLIENSKYFDRRKCTAMKDGDYRDTGNVFIFFLQGCP